MAKLEMRGLDEYIQKLQNLGRSSTGTIKQAVYVGAGIVAAEIDAAIDQIPDNNGRFVPAELPIVGLSPAQKKGLHEGLGLAKMQDDDGFINTKVGFDGYNGVVTKKFPKGQPNALIARAVESGTSRRPKYRFVAKAISKARKKAEEAMAAEMDKAINKIMEE